MSTGKTDVAVRLQRYLDEREISGNRLAKISGVSQSAVSAYLRSQKSPNITNLKIICDALGISLSEFFSDQSETGGAAYGLSTEDWPGAACRELDDMVRFSHAYISKKYNISPKK